MLCRLLSFALPALLLAGCQVAEPTTYQATTLVLPVGQPEAGREVFVEMKCTSCHQVAWEPGFPEPEDPNRGPVLDAALARLTVGRVATAIVAPSFHVPPKIREKRGDDLSPMADFTDAMTVRQLIDLVAYLRSQGETDAPG